MLIADVQRHIDVRYSRTGCLVLCSGLAGTQRQLELWTCRLDEATQLEKNFLSGCSKISNFEIPPLRFFFRIAPTQHRGGGAVVPSNEHTGTSWRFPPPTRTMDRPLGRPHAHSSPTTPRTSSRRRPCQARRSRTGIGDFMTFYWCYRDCTGIARTPEPSCSRPPRIMWCGMPVVARISRGGGGV